MLPLHKPIVDMHIKRGINVWNIIQLTSHRLFSTSLNLSQNEPSERESSTLPNATDKLPSTSKAYPSSISSLIVRLQFGHNLHH